MRKGMILYVTQGREDVPLQTGAELLETARSLGMQAILYTDRESFYQAFWEHWI